LESDKYISDKCSKFEDRAQKQPEETLTYGDWNNKGEGRSQGKCVTWKREIAQLWNGQIRKVADDDVDELMMMMIMIMEKWRCIGGYIS